MILVIDNYDSFVYNLARYVEMGGAECQVVRNDKITLSEIEALAPQAIILSPGPCTPNEAGICVDLIKEFGATIPIFGVCLGHQCIAEAYGGKTIHALKPMHGRATRICHTGTGIFTAIPDTEEFEVGRYHSLAVSLPANQKLRITAYAGDDKEIMAVEHETDPVWGVQFHPESILTEHGQLIINNVIAMAQSWNARQHGELAA